MTDDRCRRDRERHAPLWQDSRAQQPDPRHSCRMHGGADRARRRRQVDLARPDRRGAQDPDRQGRGARRRHGGRAPSPRQAIARIAYMPQGLGRNLYPTLACTKTSTSSADCSASGAAERRKRIDKLLEATGLDPFPDRPAGKLSGGMKQKVSLCCALIHDPDLLDPRRADHGRRSPLAPPVLGTDRFDPRATAGDERARRDRVYGGGRGGSTGLPPWTTARSLRRAPRRRYSPGRKRPPSKHAFIALLPPEKRSQHQEVIVRPRPESDDRTPAIEAEGPHPPVRRFHRRRSRELPHRARRDLRLPRLERLRQNDNDENADGSAASHRRLGEIVRQADGRRATWRRVETSATCRRRFRSTAS